MLCDFARNMLFLFLDNYSITFMKIGNYELTSIETGTFALDGGAMFGVVPWFFWSKTNPPDERNCVKLAARCLLLRGEGRTILIDTGNGSKWNDKLKNIYQLDNSKFTLENSLANVGVHSNDVTDVILTHLHFDHAGGCTKYVDGKLEPTFPNATHYVQEAHWELALNPTERDRASFMKEDFMLLHERGLLKFTEGEQEIFPGISLLVCNGHTMAQQLPVITDGKNTLIFICDLVPTVSHITPAYLPAYDVRPLVTIEEKKKILSRVAEENWIVFLEHDVDTEAITVQKTEKGFSIKEKLVLR